ncbi:MAG: FeoB-associated Cys-rich membrane protein [Lachnospiraceae bacterium]|nr:FeoB-associated Cys-rich membrane protein [Lachnospiraceae bacterium]MCI5587800.1 FeoB-associated Cys-rich membrane protein [Lachnospiraceae bacterium]
MGTALVVIVLIILVALAVRSMVRDKKNGKSLQCGGDCSKCGGRCH